MPGSILDRLPEELLVEILSRLFHDNGSLDVFSTCSAFAKLQVPAMRHFCRTHWPARYEAAQAALANDCEFHHLAHVIKFLRTETLANATWVPAVPALAKQRTLTAEHRGILTEWIVEVVFAMELGRETACKAAKFFDRHLQKTVLQDIIKFQLVGVSCLRAVLIQEGTYPAEKLDATKFAYMTDNTYSVEEVEAQTQALLQQYPEPLGPVASTFMQLQEPLLTGGRKDCDGEPLMQAVVELSWMLLELTLLSTPCSSLPPAHLAMAALSLSLEALGFKAHPDPLTASTALLPADLQPACEAIWQLQRQEAAPCLRALWRSNCLETAETAEAGGNDELRRVYTWLAAMVQEPRALVPYPRMRNLYPPSVASAGSS